MPYTLVLPALKHSQIASTAPQPFRQQPLKNRPELCFRLIKHAAAPNKPELQFRFVRPTLPPSPRPLAQPYRPTRRQPICSAPHPLAILFLSVESSLLYTMDLCQITPTSIS